MCKPKVSCTRKRPHSEQTPHPAQPLSKRQRISHLSNSHPPPAFWENLSKIWLTKDALQELDQRNAHTPEIFPQSPPRLNKPVTRGFVKRWREYTKNWLGSQSAVNILTYFPPSCLQDIKDLSQQGGPDLSGLRAYRKPSSSLYTAMSSSTSRSRGRNRYSRSTSNTKPTTDPTTSRSSGPYSRNFQQNLIDGGIYPDEYEYPDGQIPPRPDNWLEINEILARPRASLSPSKFSDEKFRQFKRADAHAFKEKQVSEHVIPTIRGEIGDARCIAGGIPFTNLDDLTDGTLVPGNPDCYYGARPEQLNRLVRTKLSGHIMPSTEENLPIAPNFFLAAKGRDGSGYVAEKQANYDGALGARGMQSLRSYGQTNTVYDKMAYTVTSTYHNGQLKMYTIHPLQSTTHGDKPEYYMNQLRSFSMTDSVDTFRQGATWYRNARDWTKEQRDEAINTANKTANDSEARPVTTTSFSMTSQTSIEEPNTIDSMSQQSYLPFGIDTEETTTFQESDTSSDESPSTRGQTLKRSSKYSSRSQTKRQITDGKAGQ